MSKEDLEKESVEQDIPHSETGESNDTESSIVRSDSVESEEYVAKQKKTIKKTKKSNKNDSQKITKPVESNRVIAVRGWFTWILVLANIAVFAFMIKRYGMGALLQPTTEILLHTGADYGPLVASGEKWRVVSCMFVHVGIIHLIVNMIGPFGCR